VGSYESLEKVEVRSVKVYHVDNLKWPTDNILKGSGWNVSITLKGKETKQVTIKRLLLNGRPLDTYDPVAVFDGSKYVKTGDVSFLVEYGSSRKIFIAIEKGNDKSGGIVFSPGLSLWITLQSASGITLSGFVTLN
jgi:hypothetical protein